MGMVLMVLTLFKSQQHIWVSFHTCVVPITWFSCVRDFFNAAMGALVGKQIAHSLQAWLVIQYYSGHYNG